MNKNTIIISAVVVLGVGMIIYGFSNKSGVGNSDSKSANNSQNETPPSTTRIPLDASVNNIIVPNQDSKNLPANVARPENVVPAAPGSDSKLRIFEIKIDKNKFIPDTVIVNSGDVLNLQFSAIDKNYDISQPDFGFSKSIKKGGSGLISLQASASGKFKFFCPSCGGPDKGPVGYLVIK